MPALNLAMVSFVSMMLTARSFAAKNGYDIDADKEFRALGVANVAAAFRKALRSVVLIPVPQSMTPMVVNRNWFRSSQPCLLRWWRFCLSAFAIYPCRGFGRGADHRLIVSARFKRRLNLRKRDKDAFYLALITFIAVLVIGVIPGITLAVLLGLFNFSNW